MGARSKGCISCKARRVKCDEVQPHCQRCQKAGITCKGYEVLKWVDEKPRVEQALAVARQQEDNYSAIQKFPSSMYHASQLKMAQISAAAGTLPVELDLGGFKYHILMSYLARKLSEGCFSKAGNFYVNGVPKRSNHSLNALAAIIFGQGHNTSELIIEGRHSYGKAIADLRLNLLDSKSSKSFDTMASVTTLCMYELSDRRSDTAWQHHADGLARLMEVASPTLFRNHPNKDLFLEQRSLVVWKAIFSGNGTFLNQPLWKTIPWASDPASKTILDDLVDILCDVPNYLLEINKPGGMIGGHLLDLKDRVNSSLHALNIWWKVWLQQNPIPCDEVPPSPDKTFTKDESGFIFSTLLEYNELATGYAVCIYDATRILLLQILQRISRAERQSFYFTDCEVTPEPSLPPELNNDETPLLGITSDIDGLAREILRSIEYLNTQSNEFMVNFVSVPIFDIAYSAMDANSREARWLLSKISRPLSSVFENRVPLGPITVLHSCRLMQK